MASTSKVCNFLNQPLKNFFLLWVPVLLSMLAEPLTGLVDTAFVAKLGAEALAALGVGTVTLTSSMWLFNFLSVGSQSELSQARGSDELDKGRRFGSLALMVAMSIGIVLALAAVVYAPTMANGMGATGMVGEYAISYIRWRALGAPAVLICMTSFGILYGLADMRSPLFIAVAVNALNILLDALLIFGIGSIPPMGVSGAAIASAISQWVGALCCGCIVYKRIGFTTHFIAADLQRLLNIGRDMFLRTGSLLVFLLLATRSATQLGADAGAAHQAIRQVWVFSSLFLDASAITAQSLIGYFFGAGQLHAVRKVAKAVCLLSLLVGSLLMTAMLMASSLIAALFVPVSGWAVFYSPWVVSAIFQPVAALAFVTDGIHWGTGDFRFLRNVVIAATTFGIAGILLMEFTGTESLQLIWWITGGWIFIRGAMGIARIWPGVGESPLLLSEHEA